MKGPRFLASLLSLTLVTACTTTTQGAPHPAAAIETTTSGSTPRLSTPTPKPSSSEDPEAPQIRDLANRYVEAVNKNDEPGMAQLNCANRAGLLQIAAAGEQVTTTDEIERAPVEDRYYIGLTIGGRPAPHLTIILQDGTWCVRD